MRHLRVNLQAVNSAQNRQFDALRYSQWILFLDINNRFRRERMNGEKYLNKTG